MLHPSLRHATVQFNLEIEEVECAQRDIDHWRRDPTCPMTIEVCLKVTLAACRMHRHAADFRRGSVTRHAAGPSN